MRLIDADDRIEFIKNAYCPECDNYNGVGCRGCPINDMIEAIDDAPTVDQWHYPAKGEIPDKDWSKHPLNVSEECFVLTKYGIGTIARWDNDYKTWFERMPHLPVTEVIAWQYFIPPKEEA